MEAQAVWQPAVSGGERLEFNVCSSDFRFIAVSFGHLDCSNVYVCI